METLRLGSRGPDVELLQLALTRSWYNPGEIDGIFGPSTQRSLIRYQTNNSLTPDGIAGPQTWASLIKYIEGYTTHVIRPGDTFWTIASNLGTNVSAIETANPDVNPSNLQIGQEIIVPYGYPVVPTNISYTAHLTHFVINGLVARYPFIRKRVIGKSVAGRDITAMLIGEGSVNVSYNASHHANEWITTPVLLKYTEDYALAYSRNMNIYGTSARKLYEGTTLHMIPLVNPDGIDLATGALRSGPYYNQALSFSRNYPGIPFPTGWKANINGVDLNLQYPAGWEQAREIKYSQGFTSPAPRDFVGYSPVSQPESKAMYDYTRANDFRLILAYHTQGEIIYWKYLDYLPPRSFEIATAMGNSSGYLVDETPYASGFAGYKDWFIQDYNRPGYTIEVGRGENPLPISQFDSIYRKNVGILTLGMSEMLV